MGKTERTGTTLEDCVGKRAKIHPVGDLTISPLTDKLGVSFDLVPPVRVPRNDSLVCRATAAKSFFWETNLFPGPGFVFNAYD